MGREPQGWDTWGRGGTLNRILVPPLESAQVRRRRQVWRMLRGACSRAHAGALLTWALILSPDSARVASLSRGPTRPVTWGLASEPAGHSRG